MATRLKWPMFLSLLLAVCVLIFVFANRQPDFEHVSGASSSVSAVERISAANATQPRRYHPVVTRQSASESDATRQALFEGYERSRDLAAEIDALSGQVSQGNTAAMVLTANALMECFLWSVDSSYFDTLTQFRALRRQHGWPPIPDHQVDEFRRRCQTLAGHPFRLEVPRQLMREAASAGDPVAVAPDLVDNAASLPVADVKDIAAKVLGSGDPYAIGRLASLMAIAQSSRYGDFAGGTDDEYAWWFLACDLGMDCSPSSSIVRGLCLFGTACGDGTLRDVVQQALISPQGYQHVLFLERKLLALYEAGDMNAIFVSDTSVTP